MTHDKRVDDLFAEIIGLDAALEMNIIPPSHYQAAADQFIAEFKTLPQTTRRQFCKAFNDAADKSIVAMTTQELSALSAKKDTNIHLMRWLYNTAAETLGEKTSPRVAFMAGALKTLPTQTKDNGAKLAEALRLAGWQHRR